jgi:uncharacterized protein (TIGR03083 family)
MTDTRTYFRPMGRDFVSLLESAPPEAWDRPTVAGSWRVRDVVAHLTDTALRRLSFHRDGGLSTETSSPDSDSPPDERAIAALVNDLNASWVAVARRFSPRVLSALYARAIEELADFFESLPLDAPALFSVSWAGEAKSAGWFDVAREFTEQWHHQAQVREALGAPGFRDPAWLRAVIETSLRGLPHSYRRVAAPVGTSLAIEISGDSGGVWTLRRDEERWWVARGRDGAAQARASLTDETAWRLLFNALPPDAAVRSIERTGDSRWTEPLFGARSVIL